MRIQGYLYPIILTLIVFISAAGAYVLLWNLVVGYDLIPEQDFTVGGQITVTTTMLTTSTIQTSTTVFNQTFTGVRCAGGATSCAGMGEHVAVVVNRPLINFAGLRFADIVVYDTSLSQYSLMFYHDLFFASLTTLCATWCALALLTEKRKQEQIRIAMMLRRRRMIMQQRKTLGAKTQ